MANALPARVRVSVLSGPPSPSVREALVKIARSGDQDGLGEEGGVIAVALAGGTPIGYARAEPDQANCWVLRAVTVLPQWRRKGVGTALVRACLDELRSRGADRVRVLTDEVTGSFFAGLAVAGLELEKRQEGGR